MDIITPTLWLTVGLSFYGGDFVDNGLACGGTFTYTNGVWGAVPIEWNKMGYVSCRDTLYAEFGSGRLVTVPILDFGCHLHYPIWDTNLQMGADFPNWRDWRQGEPTATGKIAVKRKDGTWWDIPPLTAWGTKWCDGPLTVRPRQFKKFVPI